MKEFRWCRGRNHQVCVEDGGRGVSLSPPLKCISLTPHGTPELAKLQAASYVELGRHLPLEYCIRDFAATEKPLLF